MLQPPDSPIDVKERSALSLAFLGDSVLELLVRGRLVAQSRLQAGALHRQTVQLVSARAQHKALEALLPLLTESEEAVVRRGRNAHKSNTAKNASNKEYDDATGLEALFGWLYLKNDEARIEALFQPIWALYLQQNGAAQ